MSQHFSRITLGLAMLFVANLVHSQEVTESGKKLGIQVETVLTGLHNPSGIAIRPGTTGEATEVFVSDSGNLRVVKMIAGKPGKLIDVITGFAKSTYGEGPVYDIGPLGMVFLNGATLVVGEGGAADGEERLLVYKLPDDDAPLTADKPDHTVGPIVAGDDSERGEGNFYGLATDADKTALYVTSHGDDAKGWVLRAAVRNNKLQALEPFIETKSVTGVDAPCGIVIAPKNWLVVGQMGEITEEVDSLLTFYDPKSGDLKLKLDMGLHDVVGLAYSPAKDANESRLYAIDFAWSAEAESGLFRLEAKKVDDPKNRSAGCVANKLVSLDKPTALAFSPDGTLYVTVIGTASEGNDEKPGRLLKITGAFSVAQAKPAEKPEKKPTEETPAEKKPTEEKPAEEKPTEEKPPKETPDVPSPSEQSNTKPAEESPPKENPVETPKTK